MVDQQVACPHCQSSVLIRAKSDQPPKQKKANPEIEVRRRAPQKSDVNETDLFAPGHAKSITKKTTVGKETTETTAKADQSKRVAPRKHPKSDTEPTGKKTTSAEPPEKFRLIKRKPTSKTPANSGKPPDTPQESGASETSATAAKQASENSSRPPEKPTQAPPVTSVLVESESDTPESQTEKSDNETSEIDLLLPPRFDVDDPEMISVRSGRSASSKVVLPDGKGGVTTVDQRIVTIEHHGQQYDLIALPAHVLRRKRIIQNVISVLIGAIVLAIVFALLRKTG